MRHSEVASRIHRFGDGIVNWYAIEEDGQLTLLDTAWRRSWPEIEQALGRIGRRPEDVAAVLLSHGHLDHMGSAERARQVTGAAVRAHELELPRVRGERLTGSPFAMVPRLLPEMWRPATIGYFVHAVRSGFFRPEWVTSPIGFGDGDKLDVPGHLRVLFTPGHTEGHCSFYSPGEGVLLSGDELSTYDPLSGRRGPRLMPPALNDDQDLARQSLDRFSGLEASLLLPGHGDPWRGSRIEVAVNRAQEADSRDGHLKRPLPRTWVSGIGERRDNRRTD